MNINSLFEKYDLSLQNEDCITCEKITQLAQLIAQDKNENCPVSIEGYKWECALVFDSTGTINIQLRWSPSFDC